MPNFSTAHLQCLPVIRLLLQKLLPFREQESDLRKNRVTVSLNVKVLRTIPKNELHSLYHCHTTGIIITAVYYSEFDGQYHMVNAKWLDY